MESAEFEAGPSVLKPETLHMLKGMGVILFIYTSIVSLLIFRPELIRSWFENRFNI